MKNHMCYYIMDVIYICPNDFICVTYIMHAVRQTI